MPYLVFRRSSFFPSGLLSASRKTTFDTQYTDVTGAAEIIAAIKISPEKLPFIERTVHTSMMNEYPIPEAIPKMHSGSGLLIQPCFPRIPAVAPMRPQQSIWKGVQGP